MLRTGTGLPIPQELLHGGEVARGPQPLAADGTRERLERDLGTPPVVHVARDAGQPQRSEEHTSELQSHSDLVCRLLLEKKKMSTSGTPSKLCCDRTREPPA